MRYGKKYFEVLGRLNNLTPDDYEERQTWMTTYMTIRNLAKKHHRLAEMDCNGGGYIRGKFYRCDGSVNRETTIFSFESDKIEAKIIKLAESINILATFQGDPRGYTVKLTDKNNTHIPIIE